MLPWLEPESPFPAAEKAWGPNSQAPGLLAASADISVGQLLQAYRKGIFPWYSAEQPVLWWSPDPRMVLYTACFKVSASLRKTLRQVLQDPEWEIRVDTEFTQVIKACAYTPRQQRIPKDFKNEGLQKAQQKVNSEISEADNATWITPAIQTAYCGLHALNYAHSVETWYAGQLVGGLYGVSIGKAFFGESMFAWRTDASKIALAALMSHLQQQGVHLVDCQQNTAHLASLGAVEIPRADFLAQVDHVVDQPPIAWHFEKNVLQRFI